MLKVWNSSELYKLFKTTVLKIPQLRFATCIEIMLQVFKQFAVGLGGLELELADILNIPRTTVHDNLRKIGYINRSKVWISHQFIKQPP
ncbi:hypothetical protein HZH68_007354 [Vespula germanica]|uniref:Uncharacterized protein n=1 Tax=Vespula germanica TaxID=30212 RepID=A0A834KAX0_VESGE|nr:hypothetical protein HZH68_007354 [Vespula germanica]